MLLFTQHMNEVQASHLFLYWSSEHYTSSLSPLFHQFIYLLYNYILTAFITIYTVHKLQKVSHVVELYTLSLPAG